MNLSPYRKLIAAIIGAVIITIPLLPDGITNAEWVTIVTAYATAFGVYRTPNQS